jgi:hypothetical protein
MANVLPVEKQVMVIAGLAKGLSIRSLERMYRVHRDTIMRLGVRIGQGCGRLLDRLMRTCPANNSSLTNFGDSLPRNSATSQTMTASAMFGHSSRSMLKPRSSRHFRVGKCDGATANAFVADLASRLQNRVQLSSDALRAYVDAIELAFGGAVDYGAKRDILPFGLRERSWRGHWRLVTATRPAPVGRGRCRAGSVGRKEGGSGRASRHCSSASRRRFVR